MAYDAYRDERERAELERERMRFVRKQARFQFEAWDIQRDQLARTNAVLRKLEAAPVASADKIETREESIPGRPGKVAKIVTRMKVKGISPSGYARVVDVHTKLTHDLSGFLVPGYKAPQAAPAAEAVAPSAQYSYDLDRLGDQELTEFRALTEKVTVVKETPPEEDADPVFE